MKFLEVSPISFIPALGEKHKEGLLDKQRGQRYHSFDCCGAASRVWSKRWFFLKESFLGYFKKNSWKVGEVFLFDSNTRITFGEKATGHRHGIDLVNSSR